MMEVRLTHHEQQRVTIWCAEHLVGDLNVGTEPDDYKE
jgi:hypothetical protein